MKIKLFYTNNEYLVTVNGCQYSFDTSKAACEFIFALRKEAA